MLIGIPGFPKSSYITISTTLNIENSQPSGAFTVHSVSIRPHQDYNTKILDLTFFVEIQFAISTLIPPFFTVCIVVVVGCIITLYYLNCSK